MTIPHSIFGGLALIAVTIHFSVGSLPAKAFGGIDNVQICGYFKQREVNGKIKEYGEMHCNPVSRFLFFQQQGRGCLVKRIYNRKATLMEF